MKTQVENIPNLGKETDIQVQKVHNVPYRIKSKRIIPRHIKIKMAFFFQERILKEASEESTSNIQGNSHKAIS